MTLKGKTNHYNVKFLSGYGLSVSLKDSKIILKNGTYPYSDSQEQEEWFITQLPYEKIVISGKGYISTDALALLNENNRNVILVNSQGKPVSQMSGLMDSMTASRYRMGQYDTFRDPEKCKYLTKQFLKAKLESQIKFLESLQKDDSKQTIQILKNYLNQVDNSLEPYKIESRAGHVYFRYYATLFDPRHKFESRNNSSIRITHRRASDPINALLNYGYAVLAGEIYKFINGIGLDAYFGFNHRSHTGFQPLVYDNIEPFRWLVEKAVYHVANTDDWRHKLLLKDYAWTKDGQVVLSDRIKKNFLERLEREFQREREYDFKHGKKTFDGLKSCQEITIAKIAVQNLAEFCDSSNKHFEIYFH